MNYTDDSPCLNKADVCMYVRGILQKAHGGIRSQH